MKTATSKHTPIRLAKTGNGRQELPIWKDREEIGCIRGEGSLDDAHLIVAAHNSYLKHCGPRAVECAEGDLLGELLDVCQTLVLATHEDEWNHGCIQVAIEQARKAIAKTTGEGE